MQFAACTKRNCLTDSAGDGRDGLHQPEMTVPELPPPPGGMPMASDEQLVREVNTTMIAAGPVPERS